jgi:hypothetical protein
MKEYHLYRTTNYWIHVEGIQAVVCRFPNEICCLFPPTMKEERNILGNWYITHIRPFTWELIEPLEMLVCTGTSIDTIEKIIIPRLIEDDKQFFGRIVGVVK